MKKILIAYYSWAGNTAKIAEMIRKETGGDLFEIVLAEAYPEDYNATVKQAKNEINKGYKPLIKNKVANISEYDTVFVGSPNWWSTIAPPVSAFLLEHDLSGKTVIPFCTHGGGGLARCAADTAKLVQDSTVLESAAFSEYEAGNAEKKVEQWVKRVLK